MPLPHPNPPPRPALKAWGHQSLRPLSHKPCSVATHSGQAQSKANLPKDACKATGRAHTGSQAPSRSRRPHAGDRWRGSRAPDDRGTPPALWPPRSLSCRRCVPGPASVRASPRRRSQRPQSPTSRGKAHRTAPRSPLSGTTGRGALQAAGTSADPASVSEPWPGRGVPQTADAPCALQMGFLKVGGCLAQVERGTVTGAAPLPALPPPRVSVQPGRPRPARLPAAEPAPHLRAVSPRTAAARCLSFLYHVPPAPPRRLPEAGLLPITLPPYCLVCSRAQHVARPRPNVC